jgi:phospholipid-binding lipoprotein MlaA
MRSMLGLVVFVAAAASSQSQAMAQSADGDPFESINRAIYAFNTAFASTVSVPVADAYRTMLPTEVQAGVDNFFTNLREPVTIVGSALEGDYSNSGNAAMRFGINSTAGIGGLFDVATAMDWTARPIDIGTALCRHDVATGPYLVLPLIGPSNLRDVVGLGATYWATYGILEDWAVSYVVVDRTVSRAADQPTNPASSYEGQRDTHLAFRQALCDGTPPTEMLKASPLGQTLAVTADAATDTGAETRPPL